MKKITQNIIRLFVISSLTCSFLVAAEEEKKKPAKKPTKTPEERFQWLDKNKDSGITIEELKVNPYWKKKPEDAAKMFKKKDKNVDGKLSKEEFVAKQQPKKKKGGQAKKKQGADKKKEQKK